MGCHGRRVLGLCPFEEEAQDFTRFHVQGLVRGLRNASPDSAGDCAFQGSCTARAIGRTQVIHSLRD